MPKLFLVIALIATPTTVSAATLYESSTLGQTGIHWSDIIDGTVPYGGINNGTFAGVRFELTVPIVTSEIGGHFLGSSFNDIFIGGNFFGAIVQLDDENDFPDSQSLHTPDVLGHTQLTFPELSDEIFGDLELSLEPGWYALVFGSGLFGTSGTGGVLRNGADIGTPDYFGLSIVAGWVDFSDFSSDPKHHRYIINGTIVPGPTAISLALATALLLAVGRHRQQRLTLMNRLVESLFSQ